MKFVIVKLETKSGARSYDDIKPDKYLSKLVLENSNGYPWKSWSDNLENALIFYSKSTAKAVVTLLESNSPFIFKTFKIRELEENQIKK